jgi:diguanylate cyclase (GGDEF)-like protein/putative nucleotidyltransferase with HDIG domain
MLWNLFDYFFRGDLFPQYHVEIWKATVIMFPVMAVQFHNFTSSFFPSQYGRWLPFAYGSLLVMISLTAAGFVLEGVTAEGGKFYPSYGLGILFVAIPLLVLVGRNFYVFGKTLKSVENPIIHNQTLALMISIGVLAFFSVVHLLPWRREFPISHFGNLIVAIILSYSVIRHRLVDIKLVLRQGAAWASLGIVGAATFWLLIIVLKSIFHYEMDFTASLVVTFASLLVSIVIYRVRGHLFELMGRAFQGASYEHRQKLSSFSNTIHNVFSLKEQGGELLALVTKAVGIRQACLLFPETGSEDFTTQFIEPNNSGNKLSDLKLKAGNPIIKYLEREQKSLSRENLSVLPIFLGLWVQDKEEIQSRDIEILMPLISRDRLIAILVLGKKVSGRYSLEDLDMLESVTSRVAISMDKEYLREQLREREEELSVINRSTAIITSSLDIQEIYGSFIEELKRVVDVSWASIVLAEDDDLSCVALSSMEGFTYQIGDKLPTEGTGTGWVIRNRKSFIENDLSKESHFKTGDNFLRQGLRTMIYLPLISKGDVIGCLIIASRQPNAYNQRNIQLLEQLASQIAMPLENAQLYARAEAKARLDELTGLLNRRTLDEMIDNEISRHSRYGGVFSLAILDLDSFKIFNDNYGHPEGDKLLRQVGHIIKSTIRNADRAFRYGGDEFAILLPLTPIDDAIQVTERVREKIAAELEGDEIKVTASIGLASWPDDGVSHTDIIAAADVTLYRAKRSGGNQSYYTAGTLAPLQFIDPEKDTEKTINSKILSVIDTLTEAIDSRSYYTCNHSGKVAEYALSIGKSLKLKPIEMNRLEICALLHDIGKIGFSDELLNKRGKLTPKEMAIMKSHPQTGAAIVSRITHLESCAEGIRHHHECYDGSGYPDGLKGEDIPLEARILAIANKYVSLTMEKSGDIESPDEDVLRVIERGAGKQFDPYLVEIFLSIYGKKSTALRENTRG